MRVAAIDIFHSSFFSRSVWMFKLALCCYRQSREKNRCLTALVPAKNHFMHKAFRHVEFVNTKFFVRSCGFFSSTYIMYLIDCYRSAEKERERERAQNIVKDLYVRSFVFWLANGSFTVAGFSSSFWVESYSRCLLCFRSIDAFSVGGSQLKIQSTTIYVDIQSSCTMNSSVVNNVKIMYFVLFRYVHFHFYSVVRTFFLSRFSLLARSFIYRLFIRKK